MNRSAFAVGTLAMTAGVLAGAGAQSALNSDALSKLLARARQTHSDSLVVLHDGKTALEFTAYKYPLPLASITKSIVSLALGLLIDDGKLALDQSASTVLTEWRGTAKSAITFRHLLGHTSGIATERTTENFDGGRDFVKYGLDAPLTTSPGEVLLYNNTAYNLLPEIALRVSGKPIDSLLNERVFQPLGIKDFTWIADHAGHRAGMSGLSLSGSDLAKVGQLMIDRGSWNGRRILSESWVTTATTAQSARFRDLGLFWWLHYDRIERFVDDAVIARWRTAGVPPALVDRVAVLRGRTLTGPQYQTALESIFSSEGVAQWAAALQNAHTTGAGVRYGNVIGYDANGTLGQYLFVYPAKRVVIVRQIADFSHIRDADDFLDIFDLAPKLTHDISARL